MCAVARGECYFKSNEENYMEECYIKKITKENVIKDIKQKCFGYLPTKMQESWWEEYDIYDKKSECAIIEAERIIKEASTFKAPQNILSRGFYKKLEEIAKDIHKDIQKPYVFWRDNPELFMKNHKALTAKYANTPITQAMINPLKTLAQQKAQPLEKLLTQRGEIESQKIAFAKQELQSRIDTLKARKKELEARSNKIPYDSKEKKEIDKEIIGIDMELREMSDVAVIMERGLLLFYNSPELDTQINALNTQIEPKELEFSLLVQEIRFLEMQKEIQKVEKMSQAQLTQYVIQHSVCSEKLEKELAKELSGWYEKEYPSGHYEFEVCADREGVVANAKKGWYAQEYLFSPVFTTYPSRGPTMPIEDEEGNRWNIEDGVSSYGDVIINRAYRLDDIMQALKANDIPALLQSLRGFAQFAKGKEDFIYQLIYWLDEKYGQRIE